MKLNKIEKVLFILIAFIFGISQRCYADVVVEPVYTNVFFDGIVVIILGIIIAFIISAIALMVIKHFGKKNSTQIEENSEEIKERNKTENKFKNIFYFTSVILVAIIYFIVFLIYNIPVFFTIIFYSALFIIIILRCLKKNNESNIIYILTIILMITISLIFGMPKIIEDFNSIIVHNKKYWRYIDNGVAADFGNQIITDNEKFIDAIIKENKNKINVTVNYNGESYSSEEELNKLKKMINNKYLYFFYISTINDIDVITITSYKKYEINFIKGMLSSYEGERKGGIIMKMIEDILYYNNLYSSKELLKINNEVPKEYKLCPGLGEIEYR